MLWCCLKIMFDSKSHPPHRNNNKFCSQSHLDDYKWWRHDIPVHTQILTSFFTGDAISTSFLILIFSDNFASGEPHIQLQFIIVGLSTFQWNISAKAADGNELWIHR